MKIKITDIEESAGKIIVTGNGEIICVSRLGTFVPKWDTFSCRNEEKRDGIR